MISAARTYYTGLINRHISNVEVLLTNPTGIGDHPDIVSAVDGEVTKLAEAADKLNALIEFFRV